MSATRGREDVPHRSMTSSAASSSRRTSLAYSAPRLPRVRSAIRWAIASSAPGSSARLVFCTRRIIFFHRTGGNPMAWEFETEPEFQAKLDWASAFVREEVEPLDFIWPGLEFTPLDETRRKVIYPLK